MTVKNYYTILGIASSASKEDIKAAYRKLVRQFHPDRNFGSEDHFKLIQEAYEILSDDEKRDVYDARLVYETYVADPNKREKFYEEQKDKPRRYRKSNVKQKAAKRKIYINSSGALVALIVLAIAGYNLVITQKGKAGQEDVKFKHSKLKHEQGDAELAANYFDRAKNYLAAQNYKFAIVFFTNAIELTPEDPKLYFNRGLVHYFLENYSLALTDLDKTIQLNPSYKNAYWVRAKLRYDLDNNDGAISDYSNAIKLDPKNDSLYFNRGLAYFYVGNYEAAINDIDKAIELNPEQPQYYFDRGDAKEMSGDTDGTCSDWQRARDLGYLSPEYKLKKCLSPGS